ncbi:ATP-binding protein [Solidesulfovibrio sp.]|uniref:ATP-binding protein n=1 Tax=Solidesulfovibrio sp. TaxID=2910990 RepID=UPI002620A764|nr:ATP-binding protein [Solidesulfovibrio sp.]
MNRFWRALAFLPAAAWRLAQGRLTFKLSIPLSIVLFVCILVWSFYHIRHQQEFARQNLIVSADRVAHTVKLGLHYAMMLNSRDDIRAIVENCGTLPGIRAIRIYNKQNEIMFSTRAGETGKRVPQSDPLCQACHSSLPPLLNPSLPRRLYGRSTDAGADVLRLASPILNEPGCSEPAGCHFHKESDKILGVLDIAFSNEDSQALIGASMSQTLWLAGILFFLSAGALSLLVVVLIKRPVSRMIKEAAALSQGVEPVAPPVSQPDELGMLAAAMRDMGHELIAKNTELGAQKDLYRNLFEGVPCLVTVQDKDYRLLRFNNAFGERFSAAKGEYCYKAYKNRDCKCVPCPVETTFETGQSVSTEESGCYKDGKKAHWIVHTAPIRDASGEIVAAMEMCLDITERKELERSLKRNERKYMDIFNNIPSAVFMLDLADPSELTVMDCNRGAVAMHGSDKQALIGKSFLDFFPNEDRLSLSQALVTGGGVNQVRRRDAEGREHYLSINASPSAFFDRPVLLVTAIDVTKRLETEQQLIQAGKMATLGEMATGVAHELNQPLSVIQTSVDLLRRRVDRGEQPEPALLARATSLMVAQVERATRIISHMREFGRKAPLHVEPVNVNEVLTKAFDIFGQQLSLRGIELVWELAERLPDVPGDPNRLEQVFINFLLNARDAVEERAEQAAQAGEGEEVVRRITVRTMANKDYVTVRISDTGGGVPACIADRIFEPFFTTKQVGKGTGLGLSISYGIIKEYGGEIHVSNNETGGASFFIRLPVAGHAGAPREGR